MLVLVALLLGVLGLIPVFKWNQFATADSAFFSQYDLFSQSLVLAKIESTTPRAVSPEIPRAGLMIAQPNAGTVYGPFDGLSRGGSVGAQAYSPYLSNPGLQGYLFLGAYSVGCDSMGCLETLNSAFTALALLGFMLLLGTIAPRSFAAVFMLTAVFSPWIVSAARNLYWVPASWFLPAIAAICLLRSSTRRHRVISVAALFACFALRFGMGFEYISTITLLAAATPLIAYAFKRAPGWNLIRAIQESVLIVLVGVAAFVVMLVCLALDSGDGNVLQGLGYVWADATQRTYGGESADLATAASLSTPVGAVLLRATVGWVSDIVAFGRGTENQVVLGPQTFWLLVLLALLVVLVRAFRRDAAWRRDVLLFIVACVVPLSWFTLAKSHAVVHANIIFVLWYMLGVSTFFWLIGRGVVDAFRVQLLVALRLTGESSTASPTNSSKNQQGSRAPRGGRSSPASLIPVSMKENSDQ